MSVTHTITVGDTLEPLLLQLVDEHNRPLDLTGDTMEIKIVDANDKDTEVLDWTSTGVTNGQVGDGSIPITGITVGDPVTITSTTHGLSTGDRIYVAATPDGPLNVNGNMVGCEEIHNRYFVITKVDANDFTLDGEHGNFHHAWVSGGLCLTKGIVKYAWLSTDVDAAGLFNVQVRRNSSSTYETMPVLGEFQVEIIEAA